MSAAAQAQTGAAADAPTQKAAENLGPAPVRLVPTLVDFLPKPAMAAGATHACTVDPLRTSPDLGAIDDKSQPLLALLRAWGRRHLRFVDAPEGCVAWATVVRAWQATTAVPVTGVLTASDLNRLADERITHFSGYRKALAAWQKDRADEAMAVPPVRPEPPPAALLVPGGTDSLADLGDARDKAAKLSAELLWIECQIGDGLAGDRICKAALETGRMTGWMLADTHYQVAWHYYKQGDRARALAQLTACLAITPGKGRALALRGSVYQQMGENVRALVDVDTAIGLLQKDKPFLANAYAVRALVVGRSGNLRAANDDNDEALRLDPDNTMAKANRGSFGSRGR